MQQEAKTKRYTPIDLTIIGGQALAAWMAIYANEDPIVTQDVDFQLSGASGLARVLEIAKVWGGQSVFPDPGDATPEFAKLIFPHIDGSSDNNFVVDFLGSPHGLEPEEVLKYRVRLVDEDAAVHFYVMHPVHCLKSLLYNHQTLPKYRNEMTRERLRKGCRVVRRFLEEVATDDPRQVYAAVELIAKLADSQHGASLFGEHQIDLLDALPSNGTPGLSQDFFKKRIPSIHQRVAVRRQARLNRLANARRRTDP